MSRQSGKSKSSNHSSVCKEIMDILNHDQPTPSCIDKSWLVAKSRGLSMSTSKNYSKSLTTISQPFSKTSEKTTISKKERKLSEKARLEKELIELRTMINEENRHVAHLEEQVARLYSQRRHLYQKNKVLQDKYTMMENRLRQMQALLCEERASSAERLRQSEAEKAASILDIERSKHKNEAYVAQLSTSVVSAMLAHRTISDEYKFLMLRLEEEIKMNLTMKHLCNSILDSKETVLIKRSNSMESFNEQSQARMADFNGEDMKEVTPINECKLESKNDEGYGSLLVQFDQLKRATSDSFLQFSLESSPPSPINFSPILSTQFSSI